MNDGWGISYEIALRWMPLDLTDDKSTLVQVMAWCRQATSHYLSQCWPRSMSPNGVTGSQWFKVTKIKKKCKSVWTIKCFRHNTHIKMWLHCTLHWGLQSTYLIIRGTPVHCGAHYFVTIICINRADEVYRDSHKTICTGILENDE